jgi:hypothetical protein
MARPYRAAPPVDDAGSAAARTSRLRRMPIEVVPAELYELAAALHAAADRADLASRQVPADRVTGAVGPAALTLGETLQTAAACLAGELRWLSSAVAGAADSWLGLDGSLLAVQGTGVPE